MPSHPGPVTARERRGGVGLHPSDISLVEHLCRVCHRHSDLSLLGAVLGLPVSARRELLELLDRLAELDLTVPDGDAVFRAWRAVSDELHAWAQRHGRDRSLSDAFTLSREAWRAAYTLEALRGLR